MTDDMDRANAIIQPPIAWALAITAGLALGWLSPLQFVPAPLPPIWIGVAVFAAGFALAMWAVATIRAAGSRIEIHKPTTAIVTHGPFAFTRNPVYLGMFTGQAGLAIGFDNLWLLAMLVPFYLIIRHGVVAREEAYLDRKFGAVYLDYKARVRRWL